MTWRRLLFMPALTCGYMAFAENLGSEVLMILGQDSTTEVFGI